MSDITITIPNEQLAQLEKKSLRLGITLEELVLLSLQEMLAQPDDDFRHAVEYVLQKNEELYQRLA